MPTNPRASSGKLEANDFAADGKNALYVSLFPFQTIGIRQNPSGQKRGHVLKVEKRSLVEGCVKANILRRCFQAFGFFHAEFPLRWFGWTPNLGANRAGVIGATSRFSGASAGALALRGGASGRGRGGSREATTLLLSDEAFSWRQFLVCLPFTLAAGFGIAEIGVRLIYRLSDPSVQVWPL